MIKLIRVCYGKKSTPKELREYHLEGQSAVGTLEEYKKLLPDEEFEIVDGVDNEKKK